MHHGIVVHVGHLPRVMMVKALHILAHYLVSLLHTLALDKTEVSELSIS